MFYGYKDLGLNSKEDWFKFLKNNKDFIFTEDDIKISYEELSSLINFKSYSNKELKNHYEEVSKEGMLDESRTILDKDGYSYNTTLADEAKGSLDGNIIVGKYIRGELSYEVSKGGAYKLQIDPTVFGLSGAFTVDLNKKSTADNSLPNAMNNSSNVPFGTKMEVEKVVYSVNSFRTSTGDDFSQPEEDYIYYVIDVEVDNNSSESVPVSSMMMFNLYDGQGYKQKINRRTN